MRCVETLDHVIRANIGPSFWRRSACSVLTEQQTSAASAYTCGSPAYTTTHHCGCDWKLYGLVAPKLGGTLLKHAQAHRDHGLADHEEGVLGAWRTAGPALLEAVLPLATTGL